MSSRFPIVLVLSAAAAMAIATPAMAAMSVATFLARAEPLRANPLMALTSPDYPVLKAEAATATHQLRAEGEARRVAGKTPVVCIPEGQSIGIMEMLDGLAALSPAEKRLPLKDGYAHVLARTYPCH
ncbi:hypothetical protein [uncultured Sphingomonas sp.]|uniref:hypothetical protein n=1 Tax=uncultured Sphingomonas sp. TaxID=158754 RepID=UPI0035CACCDD